METIKDTINRKKAPQIKDPVEFDLKLKPYEKYVLTTAWKFMRSTPEQKK